MQENKPNYVFAFVVVTALFFMWGFVTVLNDILIPYFKRIFSLSDTFSSFVQMVFFGAYGIVSLFYFLVSIRSGDPISRIGYKKGMVIALTVCALGSGLFFFAAEAISYPFFLVALFILATGVTLLQICANPYVAILGSPQSASGRLNMSQAFNSLGTTIAPLVGSSLILSAEANISTEEAAGTIQLPYVFIAAIFGMLALVIGIIRLPAFTSAEPPERKAAALKFPHLGYGMLAIFMYVGVEVAIGSFLIGYLGLPEVMGLDEKTAGRMLAFYWGGAMLGRFLGAISLGDIKNFSVKYGLMAGIALGVFAFLYFFVRAPFAEVWPYLVFMALNFCGFLLGRNRPARMLALFAAIVIALLFVSVFSSGALSMWTILAIGLFNSIMWSNIFTLAISGLGKFTSQGSALLVMMITGGAVIPVLQANLKDWLRVEGYSQQYCFLLLPLGYAYLLFYGLKGYRIGRKSNESPMENVNLHSH